MSTGQYWYWRDASLMPSFLGIDARASIAVALFIVHARLWTFELALITMFFLGLLSKFGYTIPVFTRMIKRKIAGNIVMARPWWYWDRFLRK